MPPIQQQQSSRTGLITGLVISIIFALGFLIWAIMNNADLTKKTQEADNLRNTYKTVINDASLNDLNTTKAAFGGAESDKRSLVDIATEQRKGLVKLIDGDPEGTEKKAVEDYANTLKALKDNPTLKETALPTDKGLTGIITTLAAKVSSNIAAIESAKKELGQARKELEDAKAAQTAELAKKDEAVKAASDMASKSATDAAAAIAEKQKQVDDSAAKLNDGQKQFGDALQAAQNEIQARDRKIAELAKGLESAQSRVALTRMDVKNTIVRNVDATITQLASDNIAYINLGFGDHVMPGLTFEVYDKLSGIPKLEGGLDTTNMPKGKGSVEIINVGQNSCQVRIISTTPGQTISQGDLCANLVYDKNIKPVFYVYGKFDMDGNGVATEGEAEVVKGLITRWGGKISDKINIDVDFVIMGKEPVLPSYTPEELQQPIPAAKMAEARAALTAFNNTSDDGSKLHIPIMNQNRFLYYTGYFDASKK